MNYIIFDLEATCWEKRDSSQTQEIIEIGAVKINEIGKIESTFNSFVRPKIHTNLSDYCRNLTSISQIDVNRADYFPYVLDDFLEWIGHDDDEEYLLCSWGFFDKTALEKDCMLHGLETEWLEQHISLKDQYMAFKNIKYEKLGLKKIIEKEGFTFDGTNHRAIVDAENLVKLFLKYFNLWERN